ncbi:MAG: hypothetical protein ACHQYP_09535 [Nitrospiria bacterium]
MNLFKKKRTGIIPSLIVMVFLTVVVFPAEAAPQQTRPVGSMEYGTGIYNGAFELGPGPMWFDQFRRGPVLTVDEVRNGLERWLLNVGNPRLKIGNVSEKDGETITAEVITVDNSLVERLDIDRRTGIIWQLQQPGAWMSHYWGAHRGMSWGHEMMHGWMLIPFIGMFFFFLMIIVAIMAISSIFRHRHGGWREMESLELSSLNSLNKLYASGEISRDEYLQRKRGWVK